MLPFQILVKHDLIAILPYLCSSHDFHTVLQAGLDRGFSRMQDCIAEFYKPLQKTEASIMQ